MPAATAAASSPQAEASGVADGEAEVEPAAAAPESPAPETPAAADERPDQLEIAPVDLPATVEERPDTGVAGEQVSGQTADGGPPLEPIAETVRALVLLDCIYGKVNEVKDFDAKVAKSIAEAGYIDLHPNAVAYGEQLKAR
jgi:hypothetical protein